MKSNNSDIIKELLHQISTIYTVSIWNISSLSKHFGIDENIFVMDESRNYIYIPYFPEKLDIKTLLLAGTFFFLNRKRMIRGTPRLFNTENNPDLAKFIESVLIENPYFSTEEVVKFDGIPLRLFKLGNHISCSSRFHPQLEHNKPAPISSIALDYLNRYYRKAYDIVQEGNILYFDFFDPQYSETKTIKAYLTAVSNSRGMFLTQDKLKEVSNQINMPLINTHNASYCEPQIKLSSKSFFTIDCHLLPALFLKIYLNFENRYSDLTYMPLRYNDIEKLESAPKEALKFIHRHRNKLKLQLPEYISKDDYESILKKELVNEYGFKAYNFLSDIYNNSV